MTIKAGEGGPMRNISSAKRSKDQNVCPIIQDDVLRSSIDKDMHYEHTGQVGAKKYLRESCFYYIDCSIANSLAA